MQREDRTVITDKEIDEVLGPIARALPKQADLILDIRAAARERRHPGSCVRCFFQLAAAAPQPAWLEQLRSWLERNIEIVARDRGADAIANENNAAILEHMPLMLSEDVSEHADLEAYCQSVMERFHYDRAHPASVVEMEFQYRTV